MIRRILKAAKPRSRRRAAILVMTLWIVVVLGLLSSTMLEEVHLEMRIAKFQRDDFIAMALARAGVANAIADLHNDLIADYAPQRFPVDTLADIWAQQVEKRDKLEIELGKGKYSVWVDDECAKINLNFTDVMLIKAILMELKVQEKEAAEIARAIWDWRDPDNQVMPVQGAEPPTAPEDVYYSKLAVRKSRGRDRVRYKDGDAPVVSIKNDLYTSIEELLSVPGVTPELYYGFDPEKKDLPHPIDALKERAKESRRAVRDEKPGLRDLFTVHSGGQLNINTADEFVIRCILRWVTNDPASAKTLATKIVQVRKPQGTAGAGQSGQAGFNNLQDLTMKASISQTVVAQMQRMGQLGVRSDCFRVWGLGEVNGTEHLISAVLVRKYDIHPPGQMDQIFRQFRVDPRLTSEYRRRHLNNQDQIDEVTVRVIQWFEL